MIKEVLVRGIKGSVIGVFIIHTIGAMMMLMANEVSSFSSEFLISQYVVATIVGFVFGALNILFQCERLNILEATIIHFFCVSIIYFPCAIIAGWITNDISILITTILIFVTVYFIIWLGCYLQWKRYVKDINIKLEKRRK